MPIILMIILSFLCGCLVMNLIFLTESLTRRKKLEQLHDETERLKETFEKAIRSLPTDGKCHRG